MQVARTDLLFSSSCKKSCFATHHFKYKKREFYFFNYLFQNFSYKTEKKLIKVHHDYYKIISLVGRNQMNTVLYNIIKYDVIILYTTIQTVQQQQINK